MRLYLFVHRLLPTLKAMLTIALGWGILGCTKEHPVEAFPSYVLVKQVQLVTNEQTQGSASANISEVWFFADNAFLGAYSTSTFIPVLKSGPTEIRFEAGIRDNGISATPEMYPFYEPVSAAPTLEPEKVDSFALTFRYREDTKFALLENYENGLTVFQELITGASFNRLRATEAAAFEGRAGGLIELTTEFPSVELSSIRRFSGLQERGFPVYLEVNYRSEAPVQFGILGFPRGSEIPVDARYVAGFNPSDKWKKIYFNLSQAIADSQGEEFKLILQTSLPTENDGTYTRNTANVRIDNLKLLHF